MTQRNQDYLLGNKTYDLLKNSAVVVLPALGTLYFTVGKIWGLPSVEEVVGTIAAINVFFGAVVKLGDRSYNNSEAKYDGEINIAVNSDGSKTASLDLKNYENPADVVQQDEAVFKVNQVDQ